MGRYETVALDDEQYGCTVSVADGDDLISMLSTSDGDTVETVWQVDEVLALIADLTGAVAAALANRAAA